jgi:hypothetical protein
MFSVMLPAWLRKDTPTTCDSSTVRRQTVGQRRHQSDILVVPRANGVGRMDDLTVGHIASGPSNPPSALAALGSTKICVESAHQCRARRGSIDHTIDTGPERPHSSAGKSGKSGYCEVRLPPALTWTFADREDRKSTKTKTKKLPPSCHPRSL